MNPTDVLPYISSAVLVLQAATKVPAALAELLRTCGRLANVVRHVSTPSGRPERRRRQAMRARTRAAGVLEISSTDRRGMCFACDAYQICHSNPIREKRSKGVVLSTAVELGQATKPQRHKVIGDVHLVLRRGNQVLFGQRRNTGYEDGAFHLPSGHLEADESVVDALIREAAEEVGVSIAPHNVRFSHIMHNASSGGRMAFFFTVEHWVGDPTNRELDKCSALQWFSLDALPEHMITYCRTALNHIANNQQFSTYGWQ
ncbi:NUDIX domain-containing protein [Nocardia suismassiliense]|uniref:NUDIX domain-containing protein n=1 Tax=Nocardia suismassiliense TaxID=2077092 RepID=A0ABW6QT51_9NOCA